MEHGYNLGGWELSVNSWHIHVVIISSGPFTSFRPLYIFWIFRYFRNKESHKKKVGVFLLLFINSLVVFSFVLHQKALLKLKWYFSVISWHRGCLIGPMIAVHCKSSSQQVIHCNQSWWYKPLYAGRILGLSPVGPTTVQVFYCRGILWNYC